MRLLGQSNRPPSSVPRVTAEQRNVEKEPQRNPAVLVEHLGDTHRAEYFEHYHGDRFVGVYVDVFRLGLRDNWHSSRGPYRTLKKAQSVVKGWMRSISQMARGFTEEKLQ